MIPGMSNHQSSGGRYSVLNGLEEHSDVAIRAPVESTSPAAKV
jgi:hypothetical protein